MWTERQCPSLSLTTLHRMNGIQVYFRCKGEEGHESKWHRGHIHKWATEDEDGRIDTGRAS